MRRNICAILLMASVYVLLFYPSLTLGQYDVTLSVGDGSGIVGSMCCNPNYPGNNKIELSLNNQNDKVSFIWLNIDDGAGNPLTVTGCETMGRASTLTCYPTELAGGDTKVIITGGEIDTGPEAAIATLTFSVSESATGGACADLVPDVIALEDDLGNPLTVDTVSGEFCFSDCTSQSDCDDGESCTDEVCNAGTCNHTTRVDFDPCDDGLFCTELDYCSGGVCTGVGDPCKSDGKDAECNEEEDVCNCTGGECADYYFCNGEETCDGGICDFEPPDPCSGYDGCDEERDTCYDYTVSLSVGNASGVLGDELTWILAYYNESAPFTEGAVLEGQTSGAQGEIVAIQDFGTSGLLQLALGDITDTFLDNEPIEDGVGGSALVNGEADLDYPAGKVSINLSNPYDTVQAVNMTICDVGDYLEAVPMCTYSQGCDPQIVGCELTGRTPGFACYVNEVDGCASVSMYHGTDSIAKGGGAIFSLYFAVNEGVPTGAVSLDPEIESVLSGDKECGSTSSNPGASCTDDDQCPPNPGGTCDNVVIYGQATSGQFTISCETSEQCNDGLFCNGEEVCNLGVCEADYPCDPYFCCNEIDHCLDTTDDDDCDGIMNDDDNCDDKPNGSSIGTCVALKGGMVSSYRVGGDFIFCTSNADCTDTGGTCQEFQGDCNANDMGDACECYADFNDDTRVTAPDYALLRQEFGRFDCDLIPCLADANEDDKVTAPDYAILKSEFGRYDCPVNP